MDKKKYLIRILYSFILAIIVTLAICILTLNFRKSAYSESYQSVIRDKYELLVNTESPKIVIVGGSNACFGIDNKMLSEKVEIIGSGRTDAGVSASDRCSGRRGG